VALFKKREKNPKKEKTKKPKKVKEKKQKPPKPPKPKKQPKPKKPKKVKAADNAAGEGEKKKGGKKKLLILIPLIAIVAAGAAFFLLRGKGEEPPPEDETQAEVAETNEEEEPADPENRDPNDDGNDIDEEGTEPISVSQAVNYVMTLPPSLLGLPGTVMNEYNIYPGGAVVRVDGMACTELSVYSKNDSAGTNDIVGSYLLSRGETRRLFKLDKLTKQVTEIPLPDAEPAENTDGEEAGEEAGDNE